MFAPLPLALPGRPECVSDSLCSRQGLGAPLGPVRQMLSITSCIRALCRAEDQGSPTAALPLTVLVGSSRWRAPECDLHQGTHSSPAWTWICPEEQGTENIYSSRQGGQLDLAHVHTVVPGEEFKAPPGSCISLFQDFLDKEAYSLAKPSLLSPPKLAGEWSTWISLLSGQSLP